MKHVKKLSDKTFSVYIKGRFDHLANILDVFKFLVEKTDFYKVARDDQRRLLERWASGSDIWINKNIQIKVGRSKAHKKNGK